MLYKKHFSLSEAQQILPETISILSRITLLKKNLDEKGYNIYNHQYFGGIGPNGTGRYPEDLEELIRLIKSLSDNGIIIKSIETGLVDFPHIRKNGEEVYLCFQLGEEDIEYWHGISDGFAGRKRIEDI